MPTLHCCVPKCNNTTRRNEDGQLSFHRFPLQKDIRKLWIWSIRRDIGEHFQITDNTRVCSAHFKEEDFFRTLAGLRKLKVNTKPTVFQWTVEKPYRQPPKRRCLVKEKKTNESSTDPDASFDPTDICLKDFTPCASADHDYTCKSVSDKEMLTSAQQRIKELEVQNKLLTIQKFCLERFSNDDEMISFYTGFKSYATFMAVYKSLEPSAVNMVRWTQIQRHSGAKNEDQLQGNVFRDESLNIIDQFFLFLNRIRQGFFEADLAARFNISQSTVSRILITWSNYLYFMLGSLPLWPDLDTIKQFMPSCFQTTYPKTRVILDCTEIKVQTPSSKVLNSEIYSTYKSHCTLKGLIGITPFGSVSFISPLFTGSISDKNITRQSGILTLIEEGDQIMVDKGFTIQDILEERKATVVIPPFLGEKGKFSPSEVNQTQEIARLRIHVERAIRRVKEYHIFDSVVPLSLSGSVNQIWTICCIFTNFKGPLF